VDSVVDLCDCQAKAARLISVESALTKCREDLRAQQRLHQDHLASLEREAKETIQRIQGDAETEITGTRHQMSEAQQEKQALEQTVAALNAQQEALRKALSTLSGESDATIKELEDKLTQAVSDLSMEREKGQERRRQAKVYLETLSQDKSSLEKEVAALNMQLAEVRRNEASLNQKACLLEERIELQSASCDSRLHAASQTLQETKTSLEAIVASKDAEIARLQAEQARRIDSTAQISKEMASTLQAAEAETAEHKQKRLAARNEMISLAQALEELTDLARRVDQNVQYVLIPRVLEQVATLEHIIVQLDSVCAIQSTSSLGGRLNGVGSIEMARHRSSSGSSRGGRYDRASSRDLLVTSCDDGHESKLEIEMGKANDLDPTSKVLLMDGVSRLERELDRVSTGLGLLVAGLERMHDTIVTRERYPCVRLVRRCLASLLVFRSGSPAYSTVHTEDPPVSPERVSKADYT
jgi:hypothetical protein